MIFENEEFSNRDIHIDFNNFTNCKFIECNLIYHGYGPVGMEGCSFTNVRWTFADAAASTLNFMKSLYVGAGEGGRKLIEQTFNNIKSGQTSQK
jgi:hypothetical protein